MKFVISKTTNGEFMFSLVSSNGKIIAISETYKRLQSCKDSIKSVKKCAKAKVVIEE